MKGDHDTVASARGTIAVGAGLMASFSLVDVAVGVLNTKVFATRVGSAAALFAWWLFAKSNGRISLSRFRAVAVGIGTGGAVIVGWLTGGAHSPYFAFFYLLPMLCAVLSAADHRAIIVSCVMTIVAGTAMLLEDFQLSTMLVWLAFQTVATWLCWLGWSAVVRMRKAERIAVAESAQVARLELEHKHASERAEAAEHLAEIERRASQAEKLAVLGRISAGVSHEINNPLAYVRANINFLMSHLPEGMDQDQREALSDADVGVAHVLSIVAELKSFAHADDGNERMIDLDSAIDQAIRMVRFRTKDLLVERQAILVHSAKMNRQRLVQVLMNLFINAADAMQNVSSLSEQSAGKKVVVKVEPGPLGVRLLVTDNGPGIPGELLQRLGEPFLTTKAEGTGLGLGLALSREYVSRAGGQFSARNLPEGGAQFVVDLKAA